MSVGGRYDPHSVEPEIYKFWEEGGYFHAVPDPDRKPYVIDIPLPNVTGSLHLGHALNNTIQDVLIRYKRMCGYNAMWMPGTDHAGIATQAVVEKRLKEEENLTRHEIGRDGLVERIWAWKERYGGQILQQLRGIGCSCDWERTRFTLDEVCARAVYEVFFQWFKAGLIYRGLRLVNWDAHLQTAVADDEIIHETVQSNLWHYRYPILGSVGVSPVVSDEATKRRSDEGDVAARAPARPDVAAGPRTGSSLPADAVRAALERATRPDAKMGEDYLVIATTRPETMLGDTAVAVHPDDKRYKHLIGKTCLLPLMDRPIPIIADDILVKPEFGTGCVKVTPGHDPNDYEFGQRHEAEIAKVVGQAMINILTTDGRINDSGGKYKGTSIEESRSKVVEDLEALGLMEKVEPYQHEVGHSDRSKTPIEPMLSEQWFVKMADLCELAMGAVRDGRVKFFPERYAKTYLDWLGEKRDWCISRQLWWGHRIPVWTREATLRELIDDLNAFDEDAPLDRYAAVAVLTVEEISGTRTWHDLYADHGKRLWELRDGVEPTDARVRIMLCARYNVDTSGLDLAISKLDELYGKMGLDPAALERMLENQDARRLQVDAGLGPSEADCIALAKLAEDAGFERDPDVLDTWFSSALWPFSTLGWPDNYGRDSGSKGLRDSGSGTSIPQSLSPSIPLTDLDYFYPTSTLVTARGIITLWVARMVMTSLYFNKVVPFDHVYIHPIIQDGQGRTMSKSLGNGVDPLDIIALYGTDAMRFALTQMATETQDVRLPVKPVKLPDGRTVNSSEKFELGRNFCNKLWQAATGFVFPNIKSDEATKRRSDEGAAAGSRTPSVNDRRDADATQTAGPGILSRPDWPRPLVHDDLAVEDHWILSRLSACIEEVNRRLEQYQFNEVANALYTFFWSEFCDWYVELVKPRLFSRDGAGKMVRHDDASSQVARQTLTWVLDQTLRLLHPIAPFVTEALWHQLNEVAPQRGITRIRTLSPSSAEQREQTLGPALIVAGWPDASEWKREADIEREMQALQDVIRALREIRTHVNKIRAAAKQSSIRKLPQAVVHAASDLAESLRAREAMILRLGQCAALEIGPDVSKPPESASKVLSGIEVYVPLSGLADLDVERKRLRKESTELTGHIQRLTAKLSNEGFVSKAPPEVVERERTRLADLREKLEVVERNLAEVGG